LILNNVIEKRKEKFRMSEKRQEILETLEKLKEIQRMEFDYFKHLGTLSTGSILILVAFFEKVFSDPTGEAWIVISVICFVLCIADSLLAMPSASNIVLYTIGIRMVLVSGGEDTEEVKEKAKKEVEKAMDKINDAFDSLKIYDRVTRWSFLVGLIAFLIFAGVNFYN